MKNDKFKFSSFKFKVGFTLIELMVVIVIIGVLSLIGVNSFTSSQIRSRDTKRKTDLGNIQKALEVYFNDYGQYPLSDADDGTVKGCSVGPIKCPWGGPFSDDKGTVYMLRLPGEANGSRRYFYVSPAGKDYQLYGWLENSQDQDIITPAVATNCAKSGTPLECNYGVSSGNTAP